jgi:hypothetical protein
MQSLPLNPSRFEYAERQERLEAYAKWLQRYRWRYWVVLTFDRDDFEPSAETSERRFLRWIEAIEERDGRPVGWFFLTHRGRLGRRHIHALVDTRAKPGRVLRSLWRYGYTEVERLDYARRGTRYLARIMAFEDDQAEYRFSDRLRLRKKKLVERKASR